MSPMSNKAASSSVQKGMGREDRLWLRKWHDTVSEIYGTDKERTYTDICDVSLTVQKEMIKMPIF